MDWLLPYYWAGALSASGIPMPFVGLGRSPGPRTRPPLRRSERS